MKSPKFESWAYSRDRGEGILWSVKRYGHTNTQKVHVTNLSHWYPRDFFIRPLGTPLVSKRPPYAARNLSVRPVYECR